MKFPPCAITLQETPDTPDEMAIKTHASHPAHRRDVQRRHIRASSQTVSMTFVGGDDNCFDSSSSLCRHFARLAPRQRIAATTGCTVIDEAIIKDRRHGAEFSRAIERAWSGDNRGSSIIDRSTAHSFFFVVIVNGNLYPLSVNVKFFVNSRRVFNKRLVGAEGFPIYTSDWIRWSGGARVTCCIK